MFAVHALIYETLFVKRNTFSACTANWERGGELFALMTQLNRCKTSSGLVPKSGSGGGGEGVSKHTVIIPLG